MNDPTGVYTLVRAFGAFHSTVCLLKADIINGSINDACVLSGYRQELREAPVSPPIDTPDHGSAGDHDKRADAGSTR